MLGKFGALTIGRKRHSRHGVHAGLCDVFEVHRDVPEKHSYIELMWPDRSVPNTARPTEGAVLSRSLLKKTNPILYVSLNVTYHSHTRRLLSSDVLTNRRFSSTKVMVLTAPRWRSYSCTTSPVLMSHWNRRRGELKGPQSKTANEINNNIAGQGTCARWCTGNTGDTHTDRSACWQQTNTHFYSNSFTSSFLGFFFFFPQIVAFGISQEQPSVLQCKKVLHN